MLSIAAKINIITHYTVEKKIQHGQIIHKTGEQRVRQKSSY